MTSYQVMVFSMGSDGIPFSKLLVINSLALRHLLFCTSTSKFGRRSLSKSIDFSGRLKMQDRGTLQDEIAPAPVNWSGSVQSGIIVLSCISVRLCS